MSFSSLSPEAILIFLGVLSLNKSLKRVDRKRGSLEDSDNTD